MQTIYIDVLVSLNVIISFFLLQITSVLLKANPAGIRVFAGTVMGGLYSLLIFAPDMNIFVSLLVKILICITTVYVVYKPMGIRYLFKCLGVFFGVNFIFAGAMLGLKTVLSPNYMEIKNGTVYFDFSFITIVLSAVVGYLVVLLLNMISPKYSENSTYNIKLESPFGMVECKALMDTGNTITDPYTGEPVILADLSIANKTLDYDTFKFIKGFLDKNSELNSDIKSIRLIPIVTAYGKGLVPAYRISKLTVSFHGEISVVENAEVAVSDCFGINKNNYSVLLNPYIIKESRHSKNENKLFVKK